MKLVSFKFSWERGFEDSRGQGFKDLLFEDFIKAVFLPYIIKQRLNDLEQSF